MNDFPGLLGIRTGKDRGASAPLFCAILLFMLYRACVFVDGENFRNTILSLFAKSGYQKEDYLPKNANWTALFDSLVDKAAQGMYEARRLRTYWYAADFLDFYPYGIDKSSIETARLRSIFSKDRDFREELVNLEGEALKSRIKEIRESLLKRQSVIESRWKGWRRIHNGISAASPSIEFRHAGSLKCDLFNNRFQREKAVDVKLATDLLMLRDIYDIAILVSGDQDYVPAVQVVKDAGKHVVNVTFETESGKDLPQSSFRLNLITDWNISIKYEEFRSLLGFPVPVTAPSFNTGDDIPH